MAERVIDFGPSENGNLMILGNGFDLNLSFPTSYQHFYENKNDIEHGGFPFVKGGDDYNALGQYILEQATLHSWYALEDILAEYGSKDYQNKGESPQKDIEDYNQLVNSLTLYLRSLDLTHPDKESVAARVLSGLCNSLIPPTLYSFNYTNVSSIAASLGLSVSNVKYVHGSLEMNDIILGVGDYSKLSKSYDYLYKTSNTKYKSTNLFQELDICDNILIFGLSVSKVDYPYFEGFFKKVASGAYGAERKKFIRIFTYDDESRMDILRNLRTMNQGMIALLNYADFDIIRTKDNMDEHKVKTLLEKVANEWTLDV